MFPTQHIAARTRRIGLGIAVAALAVTTLISPIGASAQEQEYETIVMGQKEQPGTQPSQPPIKIPVLSDIEITGRGKTVEGNTTRYHFLVRNLGPANAPKVNVFKQANIQEANGSGWNHVGASYLHLDLKAGEAQPVTLECTPPAGYYCAEGIGQVTLDTFADTNFSNDLALIH
jgi:hypothetical protein